MFASGTSWNDVLGDARFTAVSTDYRISDLRLRNDGGGSFSFVATPVPEPATWALAIAGLSGLLLRRRATSG